MIEVISGYRTLTVEELQLINEIKALGSRVGELVDNLARVDFYAERGLPAGERIDQRWVSIGRTHLQEGLSALVRSVAKPAGF